jgi:hypothetical protein
MIPLKVLHVYDFGADQSVVGNDLVRPEAWDGLRVRTDGPFSMPNDREGWERDATEHPALRSRSQAIDAWCRANDVATLASYGVGGGTLEWLLWNCTPQRRMICTDYGPQTVARLASLFPEAEVLEHDLRRDAPLEAGAHLFHRIDTELTAPEWHAVFDRFHDQRVLLVAAEVLDLRGFVNAWRLRLRSRGASRAGWVRNGAALERLWRATHTGQPLRAGDLMAWDLRPRR